MQSAKVMQFAALGFWISENCVRPWKRRKSPINDRKHVFTLSYKPYIRPTFLY